MVLEAICGLPGGSDISKLRPAVDSGLSEAAGSDVSTSPVTDWLCALG